MTGISTAITDVERVILARVMVEIPALLDTGGHNWRPNGLLVEE